MQTKGFTGNKNYIETPNDIKVSEKPLKTYKNNQKRVDINDLKSKLNEIEKKELKKKIFVFFLFISIISISGIYLSFN